MTNRFNHQRSELPGSLTTPDDSLARNHRVVVVPTQHLVHHSGRFIQSLVDHRLLLRLGSPSICLNTFTVCPLFCGFRQRCLQVEIRLKCRLRTSALGSLCVGQGCLHCKELFILGIQIESHLDHRLRTGSPINFHCAPLRVGRLDQPSELILRLATLTLILRSLARQYLAVSTGLAAAHQPLAPNSRPLQLELLELLPQPLAALNRFRLRIESSSKHLVVLLTTGLNISLDPLTVRFLLVSHLQRRLHVESRLRKPLLPHA